MLELRFVSFDFRALVNNVMRGMERHYDTLNGGTSASPVNNGAAPAAASTSSASSTNRAGMRQAVELKTSQPIFPGQPPPLSASREKSSSFGVQPPPRCDDNSTLLR